MSHTAVRQARRLRGLCTICSCRPPRPGFQTCAPCGRREADDRRTRRAAKLDTTTPARRLAGRLAALAAEDLP